MAKITVKDTDVTVLKINEEDYISLTDMLKAKDGGFFVTDWLRNRNTLEFIGIWENMFNPDFNYGEFATIKMSFCPQSCHFVHFYDLAHNLILFPANAEAKAEAVKIN